jgi:hypothetical protein
LHPRLRSVPRFSATPRAPSRSVCALALFALLAAGCASVPPSPSSPPEKPPGPFSPSAPSPAQAPPPAPPNVNLQGFPLEYRQGYADGCASASGPERKDATRFRADGQYRSGWEDGKTLCKKQ